MRIPLRTLPFLALLAAGALAFGDGAPTLDDPPLPVAVAMKQKKLLTVVAELRSRDVGTWPAEKVAARKRALDLLEQYAIRGVFTLHHELWPRDVPPLI